MGARRGQVGVPHVQGDRLDGVELGGGQVRPEGVETLAPPVVGHVEHPASIQVGDDRDVLVNLPRFGGHPRSHESAVGVCHGQAQAAGVHEGV